MNEVTIINAAIMAIAIGMVAVPVLLAALGLCCVFTKKEDC